ncbi:MAG TPA: XRE family transcriptional regulator [Candidatus Aminicenantes bacterium]|nr:XRE family transcriptional regulator [Candidatus Aminicenantes bacterium]
MEENRLKHFRIVAGLSVAELAAKAKITPANIYRIEGLRGKRVRLSTMTKLAKALGVSEARLFPTAEIKAAPGKSAPARALTRWEIIIRCPKCLHRFRLEVTEGEADPIEGMVICPVCAFSQTISLRRAS